MLPGPGDVPRYSSEAAWTHPTQRTPHQEVPRTQSSHPGCYVSGRTRIASPQQPVQQRFESRSPHVKDHTLRRATVCWEQQMKRTCSLHLSSHMRHEYPHELRYIDLLYPISRTHSEDICTIMSSHTTAFGPPPTTMAKFSKGKLA